MECRCGRPFATRAALTGHWSRSEACRPSLEERQAASHAAMLERSRRKRRRRGAAERRVLSPEERRRARHRQELRRRARRRAEAGLDQPLPALHAGDHELLVAARELVPLRHPGARLSWWAEELAHDLRQVAVLAMLEGRDAAAAVQAYGARERAWAVLAGPLRME